MPDISIISADQDREIAGLLAKALEEEGWSVWWDYCLTENGNPFERCRAKAFIIIWSKNSLDSSIVRLWAKVMERDKLVSVKIDDVTVPSAGKIIPLEVGALHCPFAPPSGLHK
jgi:hypothetical protein